MKIQEFYNKVFANYKDYFIGFLIYSFLLFIFILFHKDILLEWLNENRNPYLNTFFILSTKIAEEEGILIVLVILLLFRYSSFILSVISMSLATFFANLIKNITNLPRPLEVYEKIGNFQINFVPGVDVHRFMSFPSGHTAAAFAMLFFLLFISKNVYHRLAVLFLSISVAISRVYLFQHFTRDVFFASILGLLMALITLFIFIHFHWYNELEKKKGLLHDVLQIKK